MIYYTFDHRLVYGNYIAAGGGDASGSKSEHKSSCSICGNSFKSRKASHGHLRCHPERAWWVILPPPTPIGHSWTYSSSSSPILPALSDTTSAAHHHHHQSPAIPEISSMNASDWAVKAKRGRKSSVQACFHARISHGSGLPWPTDTATAAGLASQQLAQDEEYAIVSLLLLQESTGLPTKKPRLADRGQLPNKLDIASFGILCPDDHSTVSTESPLLLDRKICNATTVSSSGQEETVKISTEDDRQLQVLASSHRCKICNKAFSSYRALGGHKSSQFNKWKSPEAEELGSDGNLHQCKVCNRSFVSGQKLGGHMRRHWTTPVAAKALPLASSAPAVSVAEKEMLGFDLNEVADSDEEEQLPRAKLLQLFPC